MFNYIFIHLDVNLSYKENIFHKLTTDFMALGGDILSKDGTGNVSIYGPDFKV